MKNYYELLEVSHSASQEVIEKAYKTLAKKYHPDLQDDAHKKEAEQKMKELNEAYDVISNPQKRSAYDQELQIYEQESVKYNQDSTNYSQESANYNHESTNYNHESTNYNHESTKYNRDSAKVENGNQSQNQYQKASHSTNYNYNTQPIDTILQNQQIQYELEKEIELEKKRAIEKAYYDAYIQDLKNRGYKIKYKKTFKEHVKDIIIILILFFILFLISQIPFVKNYFISIYEENEIIKSIVDFFMDLIR